MTTDDQRIVWQRPDVLANYRSAIDLEAIAEHRKVRLAAAARPHFEPVRRSLSALPLGSELRRGGAELAVNLEAAIRIGKSEELSPNEAQALRESIRLLVPWRKGPFEMFGQHIDAEWRSDRKWERIAPALGPLAGKRVADVGCGNGYYMLRAAAAQPEMIIGLDPSEPFYYQFELAQRFIQASSVQYELLGAEHLEFFPKFFDVILCCGVLYHQRNPLEILRLIFQALAPGGTALIETQAIPGTGPYALFPEDRYAKARNVYFIPTGDCVAAWMKRTGFVEVELFSNIQLTVEEQRKTELAPYESLADFLDPVDPGKTVEGYPAPWRAALTGRRSA